MSASEPETFAQKALRRASGATHKLEPGEIVDAVPDLYIESHGELALHQNLGAIAQRRAYCIQTAWPW